MLGASKFKASTLIGLACYYMLTISINIGMFNIVIAVVSEVFEKVSSKKKEAQLLTKAEILYDFAMFTKSFCYWVEIPLDKDLKHMYIMRYKNDHVTESEWTCSINKI
jgi:hypothetical protein